MGLHGSGRACSLIKPGHSRSDRSAQRENQQLRDNQQIADDNQQSGTVDTEEIRNRASEMEEAEREEDESA